MKGRLLTILAAAMVVAASAIPLLAHHSFAAEFDSAKTVDFTGVVTKVEWMNPHVYFYVDVKDSQSGKITNWGCEMGSPNGLARQGFRDGLGYGLAGFAVLLGHRFLLEVGSRNRRAALGLRRLSGQPGTGLDLGQAAGSRCRPYRWRRRLQLGGHGGSDFRQVHGDRGAGKDIKHAVERTAIYDGAGCPGPDQRDGVADLQAAAGIVARQRGRQDKLVWGVGR